MRYMKQLFKLTLISMLCTLGMNILYAQTSPEYTIAVRPVEATEGNKATETIEESNFFWGPQAQSSGAQSSGAQFESGPDALVLLRAKLADQLEKLGEFKVISESADAAAHPALLLSTEIKDYSCEYDPDIGFIVKLELLHTVLKGEGGEAEIYFKDDNSNGANRTDDNGKKSTEFAARLTERFQDLPFRIEVNVVGTGDNSSAALFDAVEADIDEFRHKLLESTLLSPAARVLDTLAGRIIINRGRESGVRRGAEYMLTVNSRSSRKIDHKNDQKNDQKTVQSRKENQKNSKALIQVAEVYPGFSEAHVIYGKDVLVEGARLERVRQLGMRWAVQGSYHARLNDGSQIEDPVGGITSRLYFDRGFFSLTPALKADYLFDETVFTQVGAAVNWHAGSLTVYPGIFVGFGFPAEGADSYYWGGSIEIGLNWRINENFYLISDIGGSGWYYTAEESQNERFISTGIGFMLKS